MGFENALAEAIQPRRTKLLDAYMQSMDSEDTEKLLEALRDPSVLGSQITRAMNAEGMPITANSIHSWRRDNVSS
jgi:uncharacterized protein (DUF1778 family)